MTDQTNVSFDAIDPAHYRQGSVECIDALRAALGHEGFVAHCRATAIKYLWRLGRKDAALQEAKKARWYLDRIIQELEGEAKP